MCYFCALHQAIIVYYFDRSTKIYVMKKVMFYAVVMLSVFCASCTPKSEKTLSGLDPHDFETTIGDLPVQFYTLTNEAGMEVCITNFGGRIVSVMVPDRSGVMRDVVLGFDKITDYQNIPSDFGASIGRYANRINKGRIVLDGDTIQLPLNNFGHCLHGGPNGWQYKVYAAQQIDEQTLELVMDSPDGDENFPGNVTAKVIYTLTDDNAIQIAYSATTDATTVINMTNHSYFNLSGDANTTVLDNILYVNADNYTPVDSTFMTTGEIAPVAGTPMDFTIPKTIGAEINDYGFEQLKNGNGYDHNWVLSTDGDLTQVAARLYSPVSGIVLEVYTNEPGIQIYTGNFLDGTVTGKHGIVYRQRAAVCLETQHYPDSPNKPDWPTVVLEPGQTYHSDCIFKFSVME